MTVTAGSAEVKHIFGQETTLLHFTQSALLSKVPNTAQSGALSMPLGSPGTLWHSHGFSHCLPCAGAA